MEINFIMEVKKKKKKKKSNHYIDNEEFLRLIIKYQAKDMSTRDNDNLGKMILNLVNHYATKPNFCGYSYLEEMKSNALFTIWKGLNSFKPEKSNNPFSYYTSACHRAFIFIINKEKKVMERNQLYGESSLEKLESNPDYQKPAKKKWTQEIKSNQMNY